MATVMRSTSEPLSSAEIPIADSRRFEEIDQRQAKVAELLLATGCSALLLQKPANIAWFTCGLDTSRAGTGDSTAALLITRDARVVLTSNVDSPQLFDHQLPALGFQLKERRWTESRQSLIEDVCRGRSVASDLPGPRLQEVGHRLAELRLPLSAGERASLRSLGRDLAHAVEATCRHLAPGRAEAEIAGELSHRLIKRRIVPERLQVAADGRLQHYRHWTYSDQPVKDFCVLSAIGRRDGLCAGACRVVCFGEPPEALWQAYARVALVHATAMFFSQAGWPLHEVWSRIQRIYEKFGSAEEWNLSEQGEIVGYTPSEIPILPRSEFPLDAGMAVHWHPTIGPAAVGDTVLVAADRTERLTAAGEPWPLLAIEVKGVPVSVPDILRLPVTTGLKAFVETQSLDAAGDSVLNMLSGESILSPHDATESVLD